MTLDLADGSRLEAGRAVVCAGLQADRMARAFGAELRTEADSFAATLQQSVFALCPSGSGPNSIRLWEALGYGAIPVILADTLALPGDPVLWRQASVQVPETPEALAALPGQLEVLRRDPARRRAMQAAGQQLWRR